MIKLCREKLRYNRRSKVNILGRKGKKGKYRKSSEELRKKQREGSEGGGKEKLNKARN